MKQTRKKLIVAVVAVCVILSISVIALYAVLGVCLYESLLLSKARSAYDEAIEKAPDDLVPFSVLDNSINPPRQFCEAIICGDLVYSKTDSTYCFWNDLDEKELEEYGEVLTVVYRHGYKYNYGSVFFLQDDKGEVLLYYIAVPDAGDVWYAGNLDLSFSIDKTLLDIITPGVEKKGVSISDISDSVKEYSLSQYRRAKKLFNCSLTEAVDKSNKGYIVYLNMDCIINSSSTPFLKHRPSVAVYYGKVYLILRFNNSVYFAHIKDQELLNEINTYLGIFG